MGTSTQPSQVIPQCYSAAPKAADLRDNTPRDPRGVIPHFRKFPQVRQVLATAVIDPLSGMRGITGLVVRQTLR